MAPAGLVLAAGSGSRFGAPKAPVVIDGERLVDRAVRVLRDGGCDPVLVVLGAWRGEVPHARIVVNEGWAEGMGSSLRFGLDTLQRDTDAGSVVVTLVDLPGLTDTAVARIVKAEGAVVAAMYDGERGHPVRFDRELWPEIIAAAQGDTGARAFIRQYSRAVLVEVGDVASGDDLDLPVVG